MDYAGRQERLRESLSRHRLDAILLTDLPNIRYLCGFTGSAGVLLVGAGGCVFFTDSHYAQQAKSEVTAGEIVIAKKGPLAATAKGFTRRARNSRSPNAFL